MKILEHGNPKIVIMQFKCGICGCKFEINRGQQDVKANSQVDVVCGCAPYYTRCPECGQYADGDYIYN